MTEITATTFYPPSTWKRLFASWLDGLPLMIILTIGTLSSLPQGYFHASWPLLVAAWVVCLGYHGSFLYFFGATPGKMIYGLKVVSEGGRGPLTASQAAIRTLVSIVAPTAISILPQSVALFREDRRQLADLAAGTRVLQTSPRPSAPRSRKWLGSLLVLAALVAAINTLANLNRYEISADGIRLDLMPASN